MGLKHIEYLKYSQMEQIFKRDKHKWEENCNLEEKRKKIILPSLFSLMAGYENNMM